MENTNCRYYPIYSWLKKGSSLPARLCEHPDMVLYEIDRRVECIKTKPCPFGGPFEEAASDSL
jgi:hypothetical protein